MQPSTFLNLTSHVMDNNDVQLQLSDLLLILQTRCQSEAGYRLRTRAETRSVPFLQRVGNARATLL